MRLKTKLMMLAVAGLLISSVASAAGKQDFKLVNKTGYVIDQVYVSPSKANDWEDDVLGQDQLADGQSVDITFHRAETTCNWDLKVVYDDDETAVWSKLNLCEIQKVTIRWNKKTGETTATVE
jgi:hypothetical protein